MRTLLFILTILLLPSISLAQQEREMQKRPPRTDKFIRMKGIRFGYDLTRPVQHLWNKGDRYGSELSFDMEIAPNTFTVLETGWEALKINTDYIDYRGAGSYTRFGVDYNFLVAEHKQDKDILYLGVRYAISLGNQHVESFSNDNYWNNTQGSFPKQNIQAHWAELVFGTRIEVLKNLFLGWSIRSKIKISHKDYDMPPVYFIPGYGKAEKGINLDFSYSVYYNLPVDILKVFRTEK